MHQYIDNSPNVSVFQILSKTLKRKSVILLISLLSNVWRSINSLTPKGFPSTSEIIWQYSQ